MIEINNIYQGDCYELIKEIPDKSIDLIYTDIPYDFSNCGNSGGGCFGVENKPYQKEINVGKKTTYKKLAEKEYELYKNNSDSVEAEKHLQEYNRLTLKTDTVDIDSGIDFSIYDEFCRIMKEIYIYIYMAFKKTNTLHNRLFCE